MASLKDLEQRAREAILKRMIDNYKQKDVNWLNKPAIKKAILTYSFFRIENAVLIATIILTTGCVPLFLMPLAQLDFPVWLGAMIPLGVGVVAEIFFLFFSFKNERIHARAVHDLFEVDFHPAKIQHPELKSKVDKALEYWSLIDRSVKDVPAGVLRDRLARTAQEVTNWLQAVYNLAERVDKFQQNKVVVRDLQTLPKSIHKLEKKLAKEDNPAVQQQLKKTIADRKQQLKALQDLQDNMEKVAYQLDSTISALGTTYSQLLMVGDKEEEGSRISRLQEEISEQIYQLEDLSEAMEEVYRQSV